MIDSRRDLFRDLGAVWYNSIQKACTMKVRLLGLIAAVGFGLAGCGQNDPTAKATLMPGARPATRYRTHTATNPTDEQIRLLKAQTEAKARLAEIEARKAERLRQLETRRAETVARLEAEKQQKLKALELRQIENTNAANTQIAKARAQTDLAIEKERQARESARQKEQIAFERQLLIATVTVALLLMLLLYLLYRHRHNVKLKLQEEELRHKAYLEASRQHHEKVTKVLDILADEKTDKHVKKELTKLLGNSDLPPQLPS